MAIPGIVISIDVESQAEIERIVQQTHQLPAVFGYKIGALGVLSLGLSKCVRLIRASSSKLIVYDHQKAGNDIAAISKRLVRLAAEAGVNGFVVFPFAGPVIMQEISAEAASHGLRVIVGAHLTNAAFRQSEGGFIADDVPRKIFRKAAELGIVDFLLPGNLPEITASYMEELARQVHQPTFWTTGIGSQGGSIATLQNLLPPQSELMPIIGSAIYAAANPAQEVARLLNG